MHPAPCPVGTRYGCDLASNNEAFDSHDDSTQALFDQFGAHPAADGAESASSPVGASPSDAVNGSFDPVEPEHASMTVPEPADAGWEAQDDGEGHVAAESPLGIFAALHDPAGIDPQANGPEAIDAAAIEAEAAGGEFGRTGELPVAVVPAKAGRTHRFRKPALIGVAALVCALTVGGGTVAAMTKTVTISVDGSQRQVTTLAGSVDGALAAAGLTVSSHDTLAPAGGVSISDGSQIAPNRGRLFTVTVDGKKQTIWTTARTVDEALAEIGRNPANFQLSANRSRAIPLNGLQVTAASLHTVSVAKRGGKTNHVTSAARTVAALLSQQGIKLGPNDRVSPALTTVLSDGVQVTVRTLPTVLIADGAGKSAAKVSDLKTVADLLRAQHIKVGKDDVVRPALSTPLTQGLKITITRVGFRLVTKTAAVAQPADQTVDDDSMDKGTSSVTQQGQAGAIEITYRMKIVNGKAGAPQELGRKTVKQAIATVTHLGTYVAPVVVQTTAVAPTTTSSAATSTTAPATTTAKSSSSSGSAAPGSAAYYDDPSHWSVNWDAIANCESTNNWSINTGNGYYGGLQFNYGTWLGAGGGQYADRADHAAKDEQIAIAEKVYAARGLEPWACGYAAG